MLLLWVHVLSIPIDPREEYANALEEYAQHLGTRTNITAKAVANLEDDNEPYIDVPPEEALGDADANIWIDVPKLAYTKAQDYVWLESDQPMTFSSLGDRQLDAEEEDEDEEEGKGNWKRKNNHNHKPRHPNISPEESATLIGQKAWNNSNSNSNTKESTSFAANNRAHFEAFVKAHCGLKTFLDVLPTDPQAVAVCSNI
jgi:hypothetical protein